MQEIKVEEMEARLQDVPLDDKDKKLASYKPSVTGRFRLSGKLVDGKPVYKLEYVRRQFDIWPTTWKGEYEDLASAVASFTKSYNGRSAVDLYEEGDKDWV